MPRGGHFAALEEPELLLSDISEFLAMLHSVERMLAWIQWSPAWLALAPTLFE